MKSDRTYVSLLASVMIISLALAVPGVRPASADQLWAGGSTFHSGKVVSITNDAVMFQVNCKGEPRRFAWKKGGFSVTFTEGCGDKFLDGWGEPVNCSGQGRVFMIGNGNRSSKIDFISYENDTLTTGWKGKKAQERSPRKDELGIWMACN